MSKSLIGKLDVLSVFIAWALLIVFFLALGYGKLFSAPEDGATHLLYIFCAFAGAVVIHIVLAFFNRCPHCNKCLTVQGFKTPHPASSGDWSKVVWRWFSGSIVCIHCGQRVNTNGL
ncbi:MAG: hypothetical protein KJ556_00215 [Gammaproteobacteria bacterium]|nr:hypothetical protein [Gammaproteobacteria bacterium]MBU2058573.1 hypothetical protein [Gammaproteobacteria bacterium]MBU2173525.1 hypothetical protein [Gammaproteobacteria bacterium]MBU2246479.1 hypothetical protein [Gammaproteobacteria bacterium]MBU2344827.1 hypothetical protein [Gammaproteobacteria bacterium]